MNLQLGNRIIDSTKEQIDNPVTGSSSFPLNPYIERRTYIEPLVALVLLMPGLPIIGLLVLLVRLTSRGPGIFKQVRTGKNGKRFTMYKIRTMVADAEEDLGIVWSQKGDRRVTPIGQIFRKLHLDELPQLLNVLKGEMTLIGPRPERPEIVGVLAETIKGYDCRHLMKPGITGLAQINLPPDSNLFSVRRKLYLDLSYLKTATWLLDLRILIATALRVLGLNGEWCMELFQLRYTIPFDQLDDQEFDAESDGETNGEDCDHFVQFDHLFEHCAIEQQMGDGSRSADTACLANRGSNDPSLQAKCDTSTETTTKLEEQQGMATQKSPAPRPLPR